MRNNNLPFFTGLAVLEQDLFQEALHPGPSCTVLKATALPGEFQVIGHGLFEGLTHRHFGGGGGA